MLRLNAEALTTTATRCDGFRTVGAVRSHRGLIGGTLPASVGELCLIGSAAQSAALGEVIGMDGSAAQIMPFDASLQVRSGARLLGLRRPLQIPVGMGLLGRVLNGLGEPVDSGGPLRIRGRRSSVLTPPAALTRPRISQPLATGQRAIDGMLTLGCGQRIGLFAGSGVGKSTLLGEIARNAASDVNVVALIGERGREVRPFLEDALGRKGLGRSVVLVATSDESPLMRIRCLTSALAIANDFREQGANVLFLLDSLTRVAMAQREIGLLRGEPPTSRGYTPSVFQNMASLMEVLGCDEQGSITGIITVLVDGGDMDEPISDAARSILDGHIVLSRRLAEKNHYPAIDVSASLSRVFPDITAPQHQTAARAVREILATYAEVEDLVRVGAYQRGVAPKVDRAIELLPIVETFLRQETYQPCGLTDTVESLMQIAAAWSQSPASPVTE